MQNKDILKRQFNVLRNQQISEDNLLEIAFII